jgi:hypothetical protein
MPFLVTGRSNVGKKLKESWSKIANGMYYVRRGAINWLTHEFNEHKRAVAIIFDDSTFLKDINDATISFEIAAKIDGELNDDLVDELSSHAAEVLNDLMTQTDSNGDNIATCVPNSGLMIEWHDLDLNLQGIIVHVNIKY